MKIRANNLLSALAMTLDLAQKASEIKVIEDFSRVKYEYKKLSNHSMQCTYIAMELCNELNISSKIRNRVYIGSMLHDIGINSANNYYTDGSTFISDHCKSGAKILSTFPKFNDLSDIVMYHHENFNGTGPFKLLGDLIPIESQIIRLSDIIDTTYYESTSPALKDNLINWVSKNQKIFSSKIIEAFLSLSKKDVFWFNLDNISNYDFIFKKFTPEFNFDITLNEFLDISYIFSEIVDMHSSFTGKHSRDIGDLSFSIANHLHYDFEKCIKMKISGLLHDIGKLAIPKSILNKNGQLTPEEFYLIKSHAYYTNLILERIEDIEDICDWASNHHEKLNGTGYPKRLSKNSLSKEARLLAVCDIYQALSEDRPYKKGLNDDKVFKILYDSANQNLICKDSVDILKLSL